MNCWPPSLYHKKGVEKSVPELILKPAIKQANKLQKKNLPAILTLGHLAFHTDVPYRFLRRTAERAINPYRTFKIKKHSGGYRHINAPCPKLLITQKWIDKYILPELKVSPYSFAFNQGQSIVKCAEIHLGCEWLIKIDLRHFFESLSEIQVYRIFSEIGYDNLLSFEMARLCTKVLRVSSKKYKKPNWKSHNISSILNYNDDRVGHLPQGAPTSPKLSNAIMYDLDFKIANKASLFGMEYTRYADDITLSTGDKNFDRKKGVQIIRSIYSMLPMYGLRPNPQKAKIIPPGNRKVVLGLLVDSEQVKLSKCFRNKLECHLYYSVKNPIEHSKKRGFRSVLGLKNYVQGLVSYAAQIDPEYVEKLIKKNLMPIWPI